MADLVGTRVLSYLSIVIPVLRSKDRDRVNASVCGFRHFSAIGSRSCRFTSILDNKRKIRGWD